MPFEALGLALSLCFPTLMGWGYLNILFNEKDPFCFLEKVGIAFGLGSGILTLTMFYMSLVGLHFSFFWISFLSFFPMIVLHYFLTLRHRSIPKISVPSLKNALKDLRNSWKLYETVALLIILCSTVLLFFRTLIMDSDQWDSWAVWGFKAKIYFVEHIIPFQKFSLFKQVWGNWDYPHHVPLIQTWVYINLGYFNDQLARIIYPVFLLGLVTCLYCFIRKNSTRTLSLCCAFLILTYPVLNEFTVRIYSEPILIFYYILSLRLLLEWAGEGKRRLLFLSALFSGLAAWTKNEGIAYLFFNLILVFLMSKKRNSFQRLWLVLFYAATAGSIVFPWIIVKNVLNLENILVNAQHLSMPSLLKSYHLLPIAIEFWIKSLVHWDYLNLIRILFISYLILQWKDIWVSPKRYILLTIILHILLAMSLFFLDPSEQFLKDSFARLLISPSLLIIILIFYHGPPTENT